jgi:hypothetical protein
MGALWCGDGDSIKLWGADGYVLIITDQGKMGLNTLSPNSTLHVVGSFSTNLVTKSTDYTVTDNDNIVLGDASNASITFILPSAVGRTGRRYVFVKIDGSNNSVTIDANGSETINGNLTKVLVNRYDRVELVSDGSGWIIIGE